MVYNEQLRQVQDNLDAANIPSPDDLAFFDHLLYTDDPELIRSIVLEECRLGVYDTETMMRLLMEFGAVALPERVSAPIPSVSRSDPFQPVAGAILSSTKGGVNG